MTDAAIPTEQSAELQPPAASAEPQADAESADGRTYRQRILDALSDTIDAGPQSVVQLMAATGLSRNAVDSTLSVAVKRGLIERVEQGLYQLAPAKPALELPLAPAETPRADGISVAQWVQWLHAWAASEPWAGPGKPPDRETGIMVAGGGCLVPLAAWSTFLGERDAMMKQREADDVLRARLVAAASGNVHPQAKLGDMRAVHIMIASGIEVDLIETAVRAKHDRRMYPKNPPLASWPDLFPKVAELYARSVLASKMVARWNATLADPGATTAASPTLRRAMTEIAPGKPAGAPGPVAAVQQSPRPEVAPAPPPARAAATPDAEGPSATAMLLERFGAGLDDAVAAVSGDDDDAPSAMPPSPPAAEGRDAVLARFARSRSSAPAMPAPVRADRSEIAEHVKTARTPNAVPVTSEPGARPWFAPGPQPQSEVSDETYRFLLEGFAAGNMPFPRRYGPAPGMPGCKVPRHLLQEFGYYEVD